jgi:ketosteroid isomerase-like protein
MSLSKYIIAVVAIACLVLGNVGVTFSHEGEDHSKEKIQHKLSAQGKRVVSLLENYAVAIQSGNLSEIEKYVVMGNGFSSLEGAFEDLGWDNYRQHLASELPMFNDVTYELTNIRPYVKGKMAYATMDYAMNVTIKSDKFEEGKHRLEMIGKATIILVQSNKEWKIRHMHTVNAKAKKNGSEK